MSYCCTVILSLGHTSIMSLRRTVIISLGYTIIMSLGHTVIMSLGYTVIMSSDRNVINDTWEMWTCSWLPGQPWPPWQAPWCPPPGRWCRTAQACWPGTSGPDNTSCRILELFKLRDFRGFLKIEAHDCYSVVLRQWCRLQKINY